MLSQVFISGATLCLLCLSMFHQARAGDIYERWTYEEQKQWPKKFKSCGGQRQSPIDIDTSSIVINDSLKLEYENYEQLNSFRFGNDGHTVKLDIIPPGGSHSAPLGITGPALNMERYRFLQLHFHWSLTNLDGSEHAVNGHRYAMEMHFVHVHEKYLPRNIQEALEDPEGLAVLGVFFEVGRKENEYLSPLTNVLGSLNITNATRHVELKLDSLLPDDLNRFYFYKGSLTTPKCNEVVNWIVFAEPMKIGMKQMELFRSLYTNFHGEFHSIANNARHLQRHNGRTIYGSAGSGAFASHLPKQSFLSATGFAIFSSLISATTLLNRYT